MGFSFANPFHGLPNPVPHLPNPFDGIPTLPFPLPIPDKIPADIKDLLNQLIGASISPEASAIVSAYFAYLESQGSGRFKPIPQPLLGILQPHYSEVDLNAVRYADNIDTVHGQAITVENHVFFPRSVNLTRCDDASWLMHELQHCVQYKKLGGKVPFLVKYLAQVVMQVIATRSFNVHDLLGIEQEAEAKKNAIKTEVCAKMINARRPPPSTTVIRDPRIRKSLTGLRAVALDCEIDAGGLLGMNKNVLTAALTNLIKSKGLGVDPASSSKLVVGIATELRMTLPLPHRIYSVEVVLKDSALIQRPSVPAVACVIDSWRHQVASGIVFLPFSDDVLRESLGQEAVRQITKFLDDWINQK